MEGLAVAGIPIHWRIFSMGEMIRGTKTFCGPSPWCGSDSQNWFATMTGSLEFSGEFSVSPWSEGPVLPIPVPVLHPRSGEDHVDVSLRLLLLFFLCLLLYLFLTMTSVLSCHCRHHNNKLIKERRNQDWWICGWCVLCIVFVSVVVLWCVDWACRWSTNSSL